MINSDGDLTSKLMQLKCGSWSECWQKFHQQVELIVDFDGLPVSVAQFVCLGVILVIW